MRARVELALATPKVKGMGLRFVALSPRAQQIVAGAQDGNHARKQKRASGHRLYTSSEWLRVRKAVLVRDNHQCQLRLHCCLGVADRVDHVVPRTKGGSMLPDNLVAACAPCNSSKNDRYDGRRQMTVNW